MSAPKVQKPQRPLTDYKKDISWGIWFALHHRAALADADGTYQEYEKLFRHICRVMGCNCETHCLEMLEQYQVKNYIKMKNKDGKVIGCLYHSWLCHNAVNVRLGKKEMAFEDVEPLFIVGGDQLPCTAPANIDELANKFPGLIVKNDVSAKQSEQPKQGLVSRRFQLVKAT